jgi:hypothetical protein
MGWQDAPIVSAIPGVDPALADEMIAADKAGKPVDVKVGPDGKKIPAWMSAPVVEQKPAPAPAPPPEQKKYELTPGDMLPQLGAAEGAASLATGAIAAPVAGLSGLGAAIAKAFGITDADPAEIIHKVQGALTYEPRSQIGKNAASGVAYPFQKLAQGADFVGGKAAEITGSPAVGAAVNTGIQMAVPFAVSKMAGGIKNSNFVQSRLAKTEAAALEKTQQAANTNRIIGEAKEAGYTLPPTQVNPSMTNKAAEGLSGAPQVAVRAINKNQPVTNALVRKDIGLPDDIPATRQALADIRAEAGKAYEAVKDVGTITNDAQYFQDLSNITKSYDTAATSYKGVANPIADVVTSLKETTVQAPAAIEMVKILRNKADTAYRTGDAALGKAYRQSAQAIDDSLNRYLAKDAEFFNDPAMAGVVAKYQAARERIAKTYTAEKSLNEATANFDARVYGKELDKGRPLTGDAKKVAEFANAFPRVARLPERAAANTLGYGDLLAGGAKAIASGSVGKGAMSLGVRPGVRALVTSDLYQKMMVNPPKAGPGIARRSLTSLADLQSLPAVTLAEIATEQRK